MPISAHYAYFMLITAHNRPHYRHRMQCAKYGALSSFFPTRHHILTIVVPIPNPRHPDASHVPHRMPPLNELHLVFYEVRIQLGVYRIFYHILHTICLILAYMPYIH